MATGDWTANPEKPAVIQPQRLFSQLGVTDKDGWMQPAQGFKDAKEFETAVKKWLADNADKYRIQGYVEAKTTAAR